MPIDFQRISFEEANPTLTGYYRAQDRGMALRRNELQNALIQAQIKKAEAQAKLPGGGMNLPGVAGEYQAVEMMKAIYGQNSPQAMHAEEGLAAKMRQRQIAANYQESLTNTLPKRISTPLGKGYYEQNAVGQGMAPGGEPWANYMQPVDPPRPSALQQAVPAQPSDAGVFQKWISQDERPEMNASRPMPEMPTAYNPQAIQSAMEQFKKGAKPPASATDMSNTYELKRLKETGREDAAKRSLFAQNIDKTINMINPDDLMRYSGIKKQAELKKQQALAAFGEESDEYDRHVVAVRRAEALASQVRQFYGESIQPAMREKLEEMANPSGPLSDAKLGKKEFKAFTDLLKNETQTYTQALKSTAPYGEHYANQKMEEPKSYTEEDIMHTAKVNGISPEEVRQMLAEAGH